MSKNQYPTVQDVLVDTLVSGSESTAYVFVSPTTDIINLYNLQQVTILGEGSQPWAGPCRVYLANGHYPGQEVSVYAAMCASVNGFVLKTADLYQPFDGGVPALLSAAPNPTPIASKEISMSIHNFVVLRWSGRRWMVVTSTVFGDADSANNVLSSREIAGNDIANAATYGTGGPGDSGATLTNI